MDNVFVDGTCHPPLRFLICKLGVATWCVGHVAPVHHLVEINSNRQAISGASTVYVAYVCACHSRCLPDEQLPLTSITVMVTVLVTVQRLETQASPDACPNLVWTCNQM